MKLASPGEVCQPQQEKKVGRTQKQDKIIVICDTMQSFSPGTYSVTCRVSSVAWFESVWVLMLSRQETQDPETQESRKCLPQPVWKIQLQQTYAREHMANWASRLVKEAFFGAFFWQAARTRASKPKCTFRDPAGSMQFLWELSRPVWRFWWQGCNYLPHCLWMFMISYFRNSRPVMHDTWLT